MTGPRICTWPSGERVATISGMAASSSGVSGATNRMGLSAKTSGKSPSSRLVIVSNRVGSVPAGAVSVTSASLRVTDPPPSLARAAMACVAALLHKGDGTPRPCRQVASSARPAAFAAARICTAASGLSALQASKEAPSAVMRNRNVKGVITGRGALMPIFEVISAGVRRVSSSKSLDFCASDSPMASIVTCVSPIEIFECSNRSKAKRP